MQDVVHAIQAHIRQQPQSGNKYLRLQCAISEAVSRRAILPGQRLPPDKALAASIGMSLGTVQKALVNLQGQGILSRAPRRGTVVTTERVEQDDVFVFRFRDKHTGEVIPPQLRMLSIEKDDREGPWREFLGGRDLVCFRRLIRVELEPPVFSEVFTLLESAAEWLDRDPRSFPAFSVHRYLHRNHGMLSVRTESEVSIGQFDENACHYLMKDDPATGLIWDIRSFAHGDVPTSFQRIQVPPNHRPIEFRGMLSDA